MTERSGSHEPDVTLKGNEPARLSLPPSEEIPTSVWPSEIGFSHSTEPSGTRWAEVLEMLQMSRGRTGSVTSYSRRCSVHAPLSMTIELPPPPLQATFSGGGEGLG